MGQVFTSQILKLRTSEDGFSPKHEVSDILQQQDLELYDEVLTNFLLTQFRGYSYVATLSKTEIRGVLYEVWTL